MYKLFGATHTGAATIFDFLCENTDMKIGLMRAKYESWSEFKSLHRGEHVLVATSGHAVKRNAELLDKAPLVIVLCDSPVTLAEFKDIVPLDYSASPSFVFRLLQLNLVPLLELQEQVRSRALPHLEDFVTDCDMLATIIAQEKEGGFLDKYVTFTSASVSSEIRVRVTEDILGLLLQKISRAKFNERMLEWAPKRGKGKQLLGEMIEYIDSDSGVALMAALKEVGAASQSNYAAVAKKHGCSSYELKYLMTTARKRSSIHVGDVPMREIANSMKKRRLERLGAAEGGEEDE
jgi:hypothetical protein